MLRWLQTEKLAITADKLPTRYLGIDIQRTEDGFLVPQAKLISLTSNVHWHALLSRANCAQQGIHAHAHGSKSRKPQLSGNTMQDTPGALPQAVSGSHSGLQSRSDRTITVITQAHATGGGFHDARQLTQTPNNPAQATLC
jgi:hypothetical protein